MAFGHGQAYVLRQAQDNKRRYVMTLEEQIINLLIKNNMTISTVESLTGGMVSARLVNVSGASKVFGQGLVTYSNEAKHRLAGVPEEVLEACGAVSPETAQAMVLCGAKVAGSDVCIATTGIAGPTGGTEEKPVGLVYIACSIHNRAWVNRYVFDGDRMSVREQTVEKALELALDSLQEYLTL